MLEDNSKSKLEYRDKVLATGQGHAGRQDTKQNEKTKWETGGETNGRGDSTTQATLAAVPGRLCL